MSWAKLDDRASEHRKQLAAGAEACWLWACGLMYANRQPARDGFLPEEVIPILYPLAPGKRASLCARLVAVGLWDPVPNGYQIHKFQSWNRTREQVEAEREATRLRVAAFRSSRPPKPSNAVTNPAGNGVSNGSGNGVGNTNVPDPLHSPTNPDQDPRISRAARDRALGQPKKAQRLRRFPDFEPKPEHVNLAIQLGADLAAEAAKFRDHEFRDPKSDPDACFRAWLRRSIELKRQAIGARQSNRAGDGLERQLARVQQLEAEAAHGRAADRLESSGLWAPALPPKALP